MEIIGTYEKYQIVKGKIIGKPIISGGSVKGMTMDEEIIRIFIHIGQKFKSNICMDSWGPEPAGWVIEFPSCFMTTGMIDGKTPPYGLMMELAEEHAIHRNYKILSTNYSPSRGAEV